MRVEVLREEGMSIKGIARKLMISKNTVRKILHTRDNKNMKKISKLDTYKDYLLTKIEEADYTSSRLCREIRMMGYEGSYELVKKYVNPHRNKKREDAVIRFETLPGQQAQSDWKRMGAVYYSDYGCKKYTSCFTIVLGYSRDLYNEYYFNETMENLIEGHIHAFECYGGVPHEILYDCMKSVVIERYERSIVKWNEKFLDFANYYGFKPLLCAPYRAQTKGKVERPNQYIEKDFFLGRKFKNIEDLNNQAKEWLDTVANVRIHGTTKEVPAIRLEEEKKYFVLMPEKQYIWYREDHRISTKDCYISFDGNRYSIPHQYTKKRLLIKANRDDLFIYHEKQLIAQHRITIARGQVITNPEHFKGIIRKPTHIELQRIYGEFSYLGEGTKKYLDGMKNAKVNHLTWNVKKILELVSIYSKQEVLDAIEHALKYEAFGYNYIRNICRKNEKMGTGRFYSSRDILSNIFKKHGLPEVEVRDLSTYDQITEKGGTEDL